MAAIVSHPLDGIVRLAAREPVSTSAIADSDRLVAPSWLRLAVHEHGEGWQIEVIGSREGFELSVLPVDEGWEVTLQLEPSDRCYGLGERTGYLDKRGRIYRMWNKDEATPHVDTVDPLYLCVPWVIVHSPWKPAYGLYVDDPTMTSWDVGATAPGTMTVRTSRSSLDLYFVAGPKLADVVRRFTRLVGPPPLPPRWALGYHQCRYSYMSAEDVRGIAAELRRRHLPGDAVWLDIDYMDGYRVFTFDPIRFAEPDKLIADLAEQDFEVVAIVDPGVKKEAGYPVWDTGLEQGVFVADRDGAPYVGEVWPGEVGFPDFARPEVRSWWAAQHAPMLAAGIAGIWNDMNEPAVFKRADGTMPLDVRHGPGGTLSHAASHNLYALHEAQATADALKAARPGDRPFILTRAGFAGIGRFAAAWTGDNCSVWSHLELSLPMLMNLGLSGIPFCGADVGGFQGDCTGELLARWMQVGAFYPFFRNHSAKGTRDQEPWQFGPDIEAICRSALELRYQLMPYLATCFWQARIEGMPVFRPLVLEWPYDPEVADLCDQALIGPHVLICPVLRPGDRRRAIYLPSGAWHDLATGDVHEGNARKIVAAPLDVMPIFVRAGAIVPMFPAAASTAVQDRRTLTLAVFPAPNLVPARASSLLAEDPTTELDGEWFDDDGMSMDYEEGTYNRWRFAGRISGSDLEFELQALHLGYGSPTRSIRVVVAGRCVHEGPLEPETLMVEL